MRNIKRFAIGCMLCLICASAAPAQITDFTYQGRLTSSSLPANGVYEVEVKLYDALSGGNLLGTRLREVAVLNGIFSVQLDFPPALFDGSNRFLEIGVRTGGSPDPFTVLLPRQPITSVPYAIHSLNTSQLGGVVASQYVLTTDARLTDARNPLPNSASYIQNTITPQSLSNFNISGNGTAGGTLSANAINAQAQFNLGGSRILSNPGTANLFAGVGAGTSTIGINNSFFGRNAGTDNSSGNGNSFFGNSAGANSTTGNANAFFGHLSGSANTTGSSNTFFGSTAGNSNTTGSNNTIIGAGADVFDGNYSFATAIGAGAVAFGSNRIVLGRSDGSDLVLIAGQALVNEGLHVNGTVTIGSLGSSGSANLCRNPLGEISFCSSSLRYKIEVQPFSSGLDIVRHLRPISFTWKQGGMRDVGFAAEDVEKIEPVLVTYNAKGEIEGVKYGQLSTVLVNAIRQQQEVIEAQQRKVDRQEVRFRQQAEQIKTQQQQLAAQQKQLDRQRRGLEMLKRLAFAAPSAVSRRPIRRR